MENARKKRKEYRYNQKERQRKERGKIGTIIIITLNV